MALWCIALGMTAAAAIAAAALMAFANRLLWQMHRGDQTVIDTLRKEVVDMAQRIADLRPSLPLGGTVNSAIDDTPVLDPQIEDFLMRVPDEEVEANLRTDAMRMAAHGVPSPTIFERISASEQLPWQLQ